MEQYNVKEVRFCALFCFSLFYYLFVSVCVCVRVYVYMCLIVHGQTLPYMLWGQKTLSWVIHVDSGTEFRISKPWCEVVTSGLGLHGSQSNSHLSSKGDAGPSKLTFWTTLQVCKAYGSYPWHLVELWGVKTSHEGPRRRTPHWAGGGGQVREVLTQSSEGSQARRCRCRCKCRKKKKKKVLLRNTQFVGMK